MRLPFGLNLMSVLVGIAFALWVLPMILGLLARRRGAE